MCPSPRGDTGCLALHKPIWMWDIFRASYGASIPLNWVRTSGCMVPDLLMAHCTLPKLSSLCDGKGTFYNQGGKLYLFEFWNSLMVSIYKNTKEDEQRKWNPISLTGYVLTSQQSEPFEVFDPICSDWDPLGDKRPPLEDLNLEKRRHSRDPGASHGSWDQKLMSRIHEKSVLHGLFCPLLHICFVSFLLETLPLLHKAWGGIWWKML